MWNSATPQAAVARPASARRVCLRRHVAGGVPNWTPEGFIGQLFKTLGRHVPPPGVQPPSSWGSESHLRELFGTRAAAMTATRRIFHFR